MDFKDLFSFEGALSRRLYTQRALAGLLGWILVFWIPLIGRALLAGLLVVLAFAAIRRLNTLGKNPWLALLLLIPLVNYGFGIWLMFQEDK